jgi:predicted DNA-binding transcriptional regulator AlpA
MIIHPDDQIVTERQAAQVCGISLDTLRRRIKAGEGPKRIRLSPHRVGYRLSDLHTWLDSLVIEETSAA